MVRSVTIAGTTPPAAGKAVVVQVEGTSVAVFRVGDRLYAVDAKCTHVGGPLQSGTLEDTSVRCPWHGSVFSLETGQVIRGPATRPVRAYRVRAEASGLVFEVE